MIKFHLDSNPQNKRSESDVNHVTRRDEKPQTQTKDVKEKKKKI